MPDKIDTIDISNIDNRIKFPADKAVELRLKGLSLQDIADHFGVTRQAVHQRLQRLIPSNDERIAYKNNPVEIIRAKEAMMLFSLTTDEIKSTSAYQRVGMYGILNERRRLEEGKSTQNLEIHVTQEERANLKEITRQAAQNHKIQASADGDGGDNL